jgi:hypothetical protein
MRHFVIVAFLLAPALTRAEPTKEVSAMHTDDCAKARKANKTCVLDISGTEVDGTVLKKPTEDVVVPQWAKVGSLIKLRRDFIVEILKSAEDI